MRATRRVIWAGVAITFVVAAILACRFLQRRTFDPQQVTGVISGFETNAQNSLVMLIRVKNGSSRAVRFGATKITPGNEGRVTLPLLDVSHVQIEHPEREFTNANMTFEAVPWASKAPAWISDHLPERVKAGRSFEVSAKAKD